MIDLQELHRRILAGESITPDELKEAISEIRAGRSSSAATTKSRAKKAASADAGATLLASLTESLRRLDKPIPETGDEGGIR